MYHLFDCRDTQYISILLKEIFWIYTWQRIFCIKNKLKIVFIINKEGHECSIFRTLEQTVKYVSCVEVFLTGFCVIKQL